MRHSLDNNACGKASGGRGMSIGDIIIVSIIAVLVVTAIRILRKNKNSCAGCIHADSCVLKERGKCHVLENTGH